jgi:hypothetical protein
MTAVHEALTEGAVLPRQRDAPVALPLSPWLARIHAAQRLGRFATTAGALSSAENRPRRGEFASNIGERRMTEHS